MKYIISLKNTHAARENSVPLSDVVKIIPMDDKISAFLRETKITVRDIYVLEVMEVLEMFSERFKNTDIQSVGASFCSIIFEPKVRVTLYKVLKTGVVFLILFFSSRPYTAVFAFYNRAGPNPKERAFYRF